MSETNLLQIPPTAKMVVIPASITVLTKECFANAKSVAVVTFEPGSQIRRLETATFSWCISLRSICIAASVEFIARECFANAEVGGSVSSFVEVITFEPGSKLREIESGAFSGCVSLKRLFVPASVERITALSLPQSQTCRIEIERGNPFFQNKDDFVSDFYHHRLIRYYGKASEVTIPDDIETIDQHCFIFRVSIRSVVFGSMSKLSSIATLAFGRCTNLRVIAIPSSVTFLGDRCFETCRFLRVISFCPGSRLDRIPTGAFAECSDLRSIMLPS
jgi:hypothetical protein